MTIVQNIIKQAQIAEEAKKKLQPTLAENPLQGGVGFKPAPASSVVSNIVGMGQKAVAPGMPKYPDTALSAPGTITQTTTDRFVQGKMAESQNVVSDLWKAGAQKEKFVREELGVPKIAMTLSGKTYEDLKTALPDKVTKAEQKYDELSTKDASKEAWIRNQIKVPNILPYSAFANRPEVLELEKKYYNEIAPTKLNPGEALEQLKTQNKLVEASLKEEKLASMTPFERKISQTVDSIESGANKYVNPFAEGFAEGLTGLNLDTSSVLDDPLTLTQKFIRAGGSLAGFLFGLKGVSGLTSATRIGQFWNRFTSSEKTIQTLTALSKTSLDFSLMGQAQSFLRNENFVEHLKQVPVDIGSGIAFSAMGLAVDKLPKVLRPLVEGGAWAGITKAQGGTDEDAMIQGILFGGLKAFGMSPTKTKAESYMKEAERVLGVKADAPQGDILKAYKEKTKDLEQVSEEHQKVEAATMALLYPEQVSNMFSQIGSFKENKLAYMTGKEKGTLGESLETPSKKDFQKYQTQFPDMNFKGLDDMKLIRDRATGELIGVQNREGERATLGAKETPVKSVENLSPQSILKAVIDTAKKPREKQPSIKVIDKQKEFLKSIEKEVPETMKRIQRAEEPPVNKLRKGTKRIKLFEPGTKLEELVKVKEKGGLTRITRENLEDLKSIEELSRPLLFGRQFETSLRTFDQLGKKAKELFYYPIQEANANYVKEFNKQNKITEKLENFAGGKKSGERIMTYALSLESDGKEILKRMNKKVPELRPEEMEAYNYMRDKYNEWLNRLNEARSFAGKPPIEGRENYFTHIRELSVLEDLGYRLDAADINDAIKRGAHRTGPSFAYEKERVGMPKDSKIELDAFNVFRKYADSAIKYIHMAPPIAKGREMIKTDITDPITGEKFNFAEKNTRTFNFLQNFLDRASGQKTPSILDKAPLIKAGIEKLNKNIAYSSLAGNVNSAIQQPTAILNTAVEIGPRWALEGVGALMNGEGKLAFEKSTHLSSRTFETAVKDTKKGIARGTLDYMGDALIAPLVYLDSLTAQASWLGAYKKALAGEVKGVKGEKEAIRYADETVVRTQASANAFDIAPIQTTTAGKALTMFQTFVINNFDFLTKDVLGIGNKNVTQAEVFKKVATYMVGSAMVSALYEDLLGIPSPIPRPIKTLQQEGLGGAVKETASLIPVIGGSIRFGSPLGGPMYRLGISLAQLLSGQKPELTRLEMIGQLAGIPGISQLKKSLKGVKSLDEGVQAYGTDITVTPKGLDAIRAILFGPQFTKAVKKAQEKQRKQSTK